MVNGINSNNPINSYSNPKVRSSKADMDAPAFLLQYDEKGVVWDRDEKESNKESETMEPAKNGGSSQRSFAGERDNYKKQTVAGDKSSAQSPEFGEFFSSLLSKIKSFFANFLNFIWYGDEDKASDEQGNGIEESPLIKASDSLQKDNSADTYTADTDSMIKDMIARHDMDGVVDVLTKNHTIRPAHNSTLLTYYNRYGKIVDLSQTNTGRILHGDRHVKSL